MKLEQQKKGLNKRSLIVGVGFTLLFLVLIARSFYIQTVDATMLKEKARNIWNSSSVLDPKRGTIFDRNDERLAYNAPAYTVIAILSNKYNNYIVDPMQTANKLAPVLKMNESTLYSLLTKDVYQVELRPGGWKIDKEMAEEVESLGLPGIILREEVKRYYPNNSLASHLIGFVDYENKAIMGIENQYNEELSGEQGQIKVMKDLKGYGLPDTEEIYPPKDGNNIVLTIDKTIQQYVESALDKAMALYKPQKMTAIVANPKTGEILALSNRPDFNPNEYWSIQDYRNYATQYPFEPGSTFKIVTLAAAVEENLFNPEEKYQSGRWTIGKSVVPDHNNGQGWGKISFLEGVQRSSNVAFAILGYERLGKEKLFNYIQQFGFGQSTGIDISNEAKGIMHDIRQVSDIGVANIAFGQGVSVTPIQQVMAVSAIANGGYLMRPYLVKEIRDPKTDEIIQSKEPTVVRRVVSEKTAKETREILEKVVEFGQKPGFIEGYHVAGKTGTAQIIENGRYSNNKYIVSYIGFAPANDPSLIIYVAVDQPDLDVPYYGSTIAAPIFKEIMQNSLRYLKVSPDIQKENQIKEVPSIVMGNYEKQPIVSSKYDLVDKGLIPVIIGDGNVVIKQFPKESTMINSGETVYLITVPKDQYTVPNLVGKSLREAITLCTILEIPFEIDGNGVVVEQSIAPESIYKAGTLKIKLQEPQALHGSSDTNQAQGN